MTFDATALFAPPTRLELAAVEIDWALRNPIGVNYKIEAEQPLMDGSRLLVISHYVDWRHQYGAVRLPAADGPHPVILLNHAGASGVDITEIADLDTFLDDATLRDNCIVLLPTYRSETLRAGGMGNFQSSGESGEMDRDADDAIAMMDTVLRAFPERADTARLAAIGFSRGGHVAVQASMREPRLRGVVDFFGGMDFFIPDISLPAIAAIDGKPTRNPLVQIALREVVRPLQAGEINLEMARNRLLRMSPAWFAARLCPVQIHHGDGDRVVTPAQSRRLVAELEKADRRDYEYYHYPEGRHRRESLTGSVARSATFLQRVLGFNQGV